MGTPQTIQMASLGMADSLILMVMALIVFGPRRLPEIGRQIGKLMYEFRKASNDFKFQMEEELRTAEEAERRKKDEERMKALATTAQAPKLSAPEAVAGLVAESEAASAEVASEPVAEATSAETQTEETLPRIMPPSVGEQVLAARPNSLTALAKAARDENERTSATEAETGSETVQAGEAKAEASAPDTPTETEQAAQHA